MDSIDRPGADDAAAPSHPDALQLAVVARRHFLSGRTRVQIAEELGLSRFKVGRLIDEAVRTGVVEFTVHMPEGVDAELSLALSRRFGLRRAVVATPDGDDVVVVREAVAAAAAQLLPDLVGPLDVLGLTSGRTIDAVTRDLESVDPAEIVQLTGMSGGVNDNPVALIRRVAGDQTPLQMIYAPLTVDSAETAAALRKDPRISAAFAAFTRVSVALIAVGSWSPVDSRFFEGLTPEVRQRLVREGVQADVAGVLLDERGQHVGDFDDRTIGIGLEQLHRIPERLLVAGGRAKWRAVLAALRAGIPTTLVTDETVAHLLLNA